ncbi:hypothetical protein [Bizionia myxarmorum]|uniref:Uncharacterized protein n=1 Tax=Bizionia myxarmorum TaxID=291186 RepID=A0A5D0RDV7_9FLAO|nr:hypothetical protein [Bizionia myxarmorum]TYB79179.1 hypothetical protein ES674_05230 [Bizionia myxarmorum]
MFRNYPIELNLDIKNEEELRMRIISLREIFDSGVNETVFKAIVSNLHNNQQQSSANWNKKTKEEWVNFLTPFIGGRTLNIVQLDLLFNYLITYHSGIIHNNGGTFAMTIHRLNYDGRFLFEFIALHAMDVN